MSQLDPLLGPLKLYLASSGNPANERTGAILALAQESHDRWSAQKEEPAMPECERMVSNRRRPETAQAQFLREAREKLEALDRKAGRG